MDIQQVEYQLTRPGRRVLSISYQNLISYSI